MPVPPEDAGPDLGGDSCEDPLVVSSLPYSYTGDTTNAGSDHDAGDCLLVDDGTAANDHVFAYTPAVNGAFIISLLAEFDSLL